MPGKQRGAAAAQIVCYLALYASVNPIIANIARPDSITTLYTYTHPLRALRCCSTTATSIKIIIQTNFH